MFTITETVTEVDSESSFGSGDTAIIAAWAY
jgi:hypothetical protein